MVDTSRIIKRRNLKKANLIKQKKSLEVFDPLSLLLLIMLVVVLVIAILDLTS